MQKTVLPSNCSNSKCWKLYYILNVLAANVKTLIHSNYCRRKCRKLCYILKLVIANFIKYAYSNMYNCNWGNFMANSGHRKSALATVRWLLIFHFAFSKWFFILFKYHEKWSNYVGFICCILTLVVVCGVFRCKVETVKCECTSMSGGFCLPQQSTLQDKGTPHPLQSSPL